MMLVSRSELLRATEALVEASPARRKPSRIRRAADAAIEAVAAGLVLALALAWLADL